MPAQESYGAMILRSGLGDRTVSYGSRLRLGTGLTD